MTQIKIKEVKSNNLKDDIGITIFWVSIILMFVYLVWSS